MFTDLRLISLTSIVNFIQFFPVLDTVFFYSFIRFDDPHHHLHPVKFIAFALIQPNERSFLGVFFFSKFGIISSSGQ